MQRSIAAAAAAVISLAAPGVALAEGEALSGFPSWAERVVHEWTNRARCDPQVEMTACGTSCGEAGCYAPIAPLPWSDAAGRSARFHADEMRLQRYFAHDSACTVVSSIASLYPAACGGAASCACVGGVQACSPTCTAWNARIGLFGATPAGENIESGVSDPNAAFYLWLYESSASAACSFSASNGHRWGILKNTGALGTGISGTLGVMDFASSTATPSKIPSGSHYPRQAASVEAWANWYDSAGPAAAAVVVDGACTAMTLQRGSQTNGAWRAVLTGLDAGCHRYYFAFKDSGGTLITYPTTGSLGIGDPTCADFSTARPALGASCSALAACDPSPGGCDDGNPCTVDACDSVTGCTHAAAPATTECSDGLACNGVEHCDGAGACVAGPTCQDTTPSTPSSSGCGSGGGSGAGALVLALIVLVAAGPRARRRRG